ncbi:MAG: serine protease AprX [Solirubrobacteraceae bacterium]|nr:serine protease AprX [Solirubrobacteraceae bacterium]
MAVLLVLAWAGPAGAAGAPTGSQIAALSGGTAILQYDAGAARDQAAFGRELRRAGVRTVFFERLRLVAVRGTRVSIRRAARVRGVRSAHMDAPIKLLLHESVPLVYGGTNETTWASGIDGRGGAVAVVDSGIDGLHPDLVGRMAANVKVLDPGDIFDAGQPVYLECPVACSTDTTGGHGTHVAGIVAGDGHASSNYYRGVAPGTKLVGLGVGEGPSVLYALGAFEWILANHAKHGIVAVNNSWGPVSDGVRFDATDPINVASKALTDAGILVVFAAGNGGSGNGTNPEGASDCSSQPVSGGSGREPTAGACKINPYSVAPWAVSVANGRKDGEHLSFSSSRGDPSPQVSLDGQTIDYMPTLTAPGTNIRSARMLTGVNTTAVESCLSAEAPACPPPPGAELYEPYYMPLTGTSMAAPHVAGAVAVLQSEAQAKLARRLTPAEVRQALIDSATPMTAIDAFWDWPCGSPLFIDCGSHISGTTMKPYARWQVGAGYLNVKNALARVDALPAAAAAGTAPAGTAQPALPATPADSPPVQTTLPPVAGDGQARRQVHYARCLKQAARKQSRRTRARAKARCRALYG